MAQIEIKVPDIGDFKDVPVIELLVKPGDTIGKEDPLVTLESDKATMEVPSTHAGTVKEVRVKVGDKVSQGALIAVLEATSAAGTDRPTAEVVPAQPGSQSDASKDTVALKSAIAQAGAKQVRETLNSALASLD